MTRLSLTPEDELADGVEPLSADEQRWLRRLERVLRDMPDRLLLVERADSMILVDRAAARESVLADGAAEHDGIVLAAIVNSCFKVTGVSG